LIDYEFLNQLYNGLELIKEMKLQNRAVLVTSHFDEKHIQEQSQILDLKLLPKNLVAWVPIVSTPVRLLYKFVLLDDDELIHASWKLVAGKNAAAALFFKDAIELQTQSATIDPQTPIYVDQNLGHNSLLNGSQILEKLFAQGFRNLFLCTGELDLPATDKYKVRGKDYPFD
jgi:hypothetical protein